MMLRILKDIPDYVKNIKRQNPDYVKNIKRQNPDYITNIKRQNSDDVKDMKRQNPDDVKNIKRQKSCIFNVNCVVENPSMITKSNSSGQFMGEASPYASSIHSSTLPHDSSLNSSQGKLRDK